MKRSIEREEMLAGPIQPWNPESITFHGLIQMHVAQNLADRAWRALNGSGNKAKVVVLCECGVVYKAPQSNPVTRHVAEHALESHRIADPNSTIVMV